MPHLHYIYWSIPIRPNIKDPRVAQLGYKAMVSGGLQLTGGLQLNGGLQL